MKFLDQVKIFVKAGTGGSGSASMRREKFIEFGGPDGGNGGKGASIIIKSERNKTTRGIEKAMLLSEKLSPPNNAIAVTGEKFGG